MGLFGQWGDPMNLNGTDRSVKVKVYLTDNYDSFGHGSEEHKKYLPCMAILERLSGDNFYDFTLLTEDGPIRSCGYGAFYSSADVTKKLTRHVWHIQAFEPIEKVEDTKQSVVVVYGDDRFMPTDKMDVYEDIDTVIPVIDKYDRWALISDLVFEK